MAVRLDRVRYCRPSCADCNRIGLPLLPGMLVAMEKVLGPDMLRAFLLAYGGRAYATRLTLAVMAPVGQADAWTQAAYSGMNLRVSKGPASRLAYPDWTRLCVL